MARLGNFLERDYGVRVTRFLATALSTRSAFELHLDRGLRRSGPGVVIIYLSTYFASFTRGGCRRPYLCLYQSVPGRSSTMVAPQDVSGLVARANPDATVLFVGNLQQLSSGGEVPSDDLGLPEGLHAGFLKELAGRSASLVSIQDGRETRAPIDICEGLTATLRDAAAAGHPLRVDALVSGAQRYVSDSGGRVSTVLPDTVGDLPVVRPVVARETLADYVRRDLFSPDPGSRMDAVIELGAEAGSSARASELLEDLAAHDRAVDVRALAESRLRRASRPRRETDLATLVPPALERAARAALPWPDFVEVPSGSYEMGVEKPLGQPFERRRGATRLPAFALARTPVTNRDFLSYVLGGDADWPDHWTSGRVFREDLEAPVVCVSWYDAMSYCTWLTARAQALGVLPAGRRVTLPSEAEWEVVARNRSTDLHPWGDIFDAACCNVRSSGHLRVLPVGSFSPAGDSAEGCVDLVGNAWEWTRSLWGKGGRAPDYRYPYGFRDGRESLSADGAVRRVMRGGAFYYEDGCANSYTRNRMFPDARHPGGGFRAALTSTAESAR